LRGFEMLFFRKNQKIPKKEENSKKPLRHLWDVSKRLHKIDIGKKRDPFLVESWKKHVLPTYQDFFYMDSKNVQKTRFYACLKTKSLYTVIDKNVKNACRVSIFCRVTFAKYSTLGIAHTFHQSW
jgi:hypothetical protein